MMALELDRIFQGGRIPGWLQKFEANPSEALEDLLLGRAALGHLNADEPVEILLDWLESLGERSEFPAQVDAALAEWIERSWGRSRLPKTESAAVLAVAWTRAANLIAFEPRLVQAARRLRAHFPQDRSFLSALSEGRARDPEGRAWLAVARHQEDRSLLSDWWRLCNLAPDAPWYHGIYGIQGLRGLPAESASREGAFPTEVAEGLARLASGLARRAGEGWLEPTTASEEFLRMARLTMSAYPAARWVSFWRHSLQENRFRDGGEEARPWIQDLFPQELKNREDSERRGGQRRWIQPDINWSRTAQRIAARLRERDFGVLGEAEQLLREQKKFAEITGDAYFLVRSACFFAARVRDFRPSLALEWAELARRFDPWHAFAWTTAATSLLALKRLSEAHDVAVGAVQRFPQNPVARNTLGEVLRAEDRFLEAEAVYRETVSRFPENDVARNGLAEVLKQQSRYFEAETVYRETMSRFPRDVVSRAGLAEVLKEQGRLLEAEAVYGETMSRFPEDVVTRNGLAEVLRAQGRYPEAEAVYRETIEKFPNAENARSGLRGLLRGLQEPHEDETSLELSGIKSARHGGVGQDKQLEDLLGSPDVDILLQDIYLLRRWAIKTDHTLLRSSPGELREMARQRLRALLDSGKASSELVGELGLLSLGEQDLEVTLTLLREAAKRYPGSAKVRYTLARAEREAAALRQHLDPKISEAPTLPWRRLGRMDERLVPLQLLGEARTWLVQVDGSFLDEQARDTLGKLAYQIQHLKPFRPEIEEAEDRSRDFVSWWTDEIRLNVFGGEPVASYQDITDLVSIRQNLDQNAMVLDRLEEDWVTHWARA
jgi:tetratricopeptide (TPR) repeat protein